MGGEACWPPVEGEVTSEYGIRSDPFTGEARFHHGLDVGAAQGTPVKAVRDGTVVFSGERGGYGNVVEVAHEDGFSTLYAHGHELLVKKGEKISAGSAIMTVGSTGKSTGSHLHFEVRREGRTVDPKSYISSLSFSGGQR